MKRQIVGALRALALVGVVAAPAQAADWIVRVGGHSVNPKSDNHPVVNVDDGQSVTFNVTYMATEKLGIELLAALPFKHDINLNTNGSKVAETRHLPPTLSLQYHFAPRARFRPYVGAGLNYTLFFDEKTRGALAGTRLSLDGSFGPSLQVGADIPIGETWFLNVDLRWFDIDTDAKLNGASLGTVEIDPFAYGVTIGRKFSW